MQRNLLIAAASCVLSLGAFAPHAAHATTWNVSGALDCGGTFSGFFDTNASGKVVYTDIQESGGCSPGLYETDSFAAAKGYSPLYNITPDGFTVSGTIGDNLGLVFVDQLTPAPVGTVDALVTTQHDQYGHIIDYGLGGLTSLKLDGYGDAIGVDSGQATVGVPEPTAWALMLTGFAGLGLAVRRRRRIAAA